MNIGTISNILVQAIKPSRFGVMLKKAVKRIRDPIGSLSIAQNSSWLASNKSEFEVLANELDRDLWQESLEAADVIDKNATRTLESIEHSLGGGGAYPFLFFLTRYMQPACVVETGVAAGYSSYSFLEAMKANGKGTLLSSDFPYFRLPNPESYIGIVIPEELKDRWEVLIDGDEVNLPRIAEKVNSIDIFHYDSDKSYSGREFAMSIVGDLLNDHGIVLMDDIQDNAFFHDWITKTQPDSWFVFEFENKYVGMLGLPSRSAP